MLQDETIWDVYTFELGEKKELTYVDGHYEGLPHSSDTFYMSHQITEALPGDHQDGAILELTLLGKYTSVFLEDNLLYTNYPNAENRIGSIQFPMENPEEMILQRRIYISLPSDYVGKTLTIAQSEPSQPGVNDTGGTVYTCFAKITTVEALDSYSVAGTAKSYMPSILLMVIAIVLISLFLLRLYQKKWDWSLLLLALSAFLWSLTYLFLLPYSRSWEYAIPGRYEDYIIKLYAVPIFIYLCIKLKKYRKWSILLFAILIVITVLEQSGILFTLPFSITNKIFHITSAAKIFVYIALIFLCLLEWQKRHPARTRLIKQIGLGALLVFLACGIIMLTPTAASEIVYNLFLTCYFLLQKTVMLAVLVVAIVITLFDFAMEAVQKKIDLEILRAREMTANEGYQNLSRYTEHVSMLRHDMKNHFLIIQSMLKQKEYEKANDYIKNLISQDDAIIPAIHTRNSLVNMILNSKLGEIEKSKIHLNLEIDVPEHLPLLDNELNSVLANILDNALAALKELPPTSKSFFSLKMHIKNNFLYISSKNTYSPAKKTLESSSELTQHRGYGLKIIEKIAKKHNGFMTINKEDTTFEINVAIKI